MLAPVCPFPGTRGQGTLTDRESQAVGKVYPFVTHATVLIPTTADRGPLLQFSVATVQAQTLEDIEIMIVGDGVDDATRATVQKLATDDPRIRFFDFPKDERRGERNRHQLLTNEVQGHFVAYLCDRDLWLPNHLEISGELLADADFAYTLRFTIGEDGKPKLFWRSDLSDPAVQARHMEFGDMLIPLSMVSHTMDAYRRLPHGWRTTPPGIATDRHMWNQFLEQPWCRVAASWAPTVLRFKRGNHPGLSVAQRLAEIETWADRMHKPGFATSLHLGIIEAQGRDRAALTQQLTDQSMMIRVRDRLPPASVSAARRVASRTLPRSVRRRLHPRRPY